ncbi:MAG TPA: histone deacetylase [Anaeromyxobacteraceae bacterium]|nr:histone deacetylase [Anaeromyxobacteraceae bacterium]
MPLPTVLVTHPACNRHDTGAGHPESRARLPALLEAVRRDAGLAPTLREHQARPAGEEDLLRVHTPEHVVWIQKGAAEARRRGEILWLDPDTAVSAESWDAALAAAGCAIDAAGLAARGEAAGAFALCRPPGHHATVHRAMGFCLFNNLAVAARAMQAHGLAERILVVDWDVHHGNGTQDVFYADPSVSFLSLHLWPHYPGTGGAGERGAGAGEGHTRNVPLPHGTTAAEYRRRFLEALDEVLASFAPDLVLVSAGFDCLAGDPLGGFGLEPGDLHRLTADLLERTRQTARGRVAAMLEGGYVGERIGQGLVNLLRAFAGLPPAGQP